MKKRMLGDLSVSAVGFIAKGCGSPETVWDGTDGTPLLHEAEEWLRKHHF